MYELSDLIDVEETQHLLDSFCDAVGIAAAIIDLGGELLVGSRWQRVCTDFHRVNERTCEKCIESDTQLANELQEGKRFSIYQCQNGLTDAASPIIIEGEHIANAFVGQFFLKKPDQEFFSRQAATYGFEETAYLDALSEVPIVKEEYLPVILNFLASFAEMVAKMGLVHMQQIEAQEALQESEEKYRNIVENTLDAIMLTRPDGIISYLSPACKEVLGYDPEDLVSKQPWIMHPDDLEKVKEVHYQALKGKSGSNFEYRIKTKKGEMKWVSHAWSPILTDGKLQLIVSVIRDITERRQMEEILRESEEKYRILVENANDAIYIAQDGVIKFPNPKAEELTGYSAEEAAEMPFVNFIHPEDREMVFASYQRRLKGEEPPSPYSFRIRNKAGEELLVQLNSVLVTWEGRPATLNFLRDITQQKKLEAQLQQSQKMEAIGTLAGGIAHDFNNILMGIQGHVSLMSLDTNSDHPHSEHLKGIEALVIRAADLTRQLLGFARGGKYEVKPTDLNNLIKKSSEMFGRTKKEITIRRKYQKNIWTVEVDRGQIEQVFLNLYVNAWQAMDRGGELYLQTENTTLDESYVKPFQVKPGNYVKITVTDTGEGMDEETQRRIFDPFFTTKETGGGTGLGLASAYGIIKNHGGIINVYSEKGKGTTFTIYLPASEKEIPKEKKGPEGVLKGKETVLLIDDEDMIIEVGEEILKSLGYKVMIARSGKEAIEIYKENKDKIDMVIMDMIMPEMSGGKTYDLLKEINPNIKVLLSSGYSINGQATEIMERGCDGFIQKPFNMEQLSRKMREILDRGAITGRVG